jgi:hypothetical protein
MFKSLFLKFDVFGMKKHHAKAYLFREKDIF